MSRSTDTHMRKLSFLGFNPKSGTDGNGDPNEVQLDAEMEKVFAGTDDKEKFDVSQLSDTNNLPQTAATKFDESDYDLHRTDEYPHIHTTQIKSARSMKRQDSKDLVSSPDEPSSPSTERVDQRVVIGYNKVPGVRAPSPVRVSDSNSSDDPQVSQRASHSQKDNDYDDTKRVQFNKARERKADVYDDIPEDDDRYQKKDNSDLDDDRRRRKGRHQHYKHRKHSLPENAGARKQSGAEIPPTGRRISVQPEDASLEEADIEELTSHRSDDPRGMRRHRVQPSSQTGRGQKDGTVNAKPPLPPINKKLIDHSPHEVFVQLDELTGTGEDCEWKETARWIKYEEDVEEGADRWGRPHVASLSFHSLLNLRRCLETGVVLMDLEEKDLPGVAYRVVEQMVVEELIYPDEKPTIMRALLLRHRHVNDHSGFHFGTRRKYSSYTSLQNLNDDKKPKIVPMNELNGHGGDTKIDMKEEVYTASQEDLRKAAMHDTILKRIPQGAEATTVLVGAVDFLEQPTIAFVRLAEGISMPSITEVPIPVRFLFILLGPKNAELDYHEIGRSIATLMSNQHFHEIAYKAHDRKVLLSAINEFLDDSIVLPPGNWERQELLPIEELKAKSERIRNRKNKALQKEKNKDKKAIADEEKKLLAGSGDPGKRKPVGPMERTHRLWGGMINDMKRRWPMYKSDIVDGLNTETLAATLFMYFAALSTAITFGGLASDKTHNLIGISETLLSASLVGLVFHAIAGQPLVIIGTTGPLLLFDEALYEFCDQNNFNFLTVRVYVGLWLSIIALVVSAFEGSVLVRLFTRFTQEIFSALITLIYLVETLMKLLYVYGRHPLHANYTYIQPEEVMVKPIGVVLTNLTIEDGSNSTVTIEDEASTIISTITENITEAVTTVAEIILSNAPASNQSGLIPYDDIGPLNQPNTALFCTILTLGTFALAYYLKLFRNGQFLGRTARRALGDFGVPISIAIFVAISYVTPQVYTDKLSVPEGISPSDPERRGWLIPWGPVPLWLPFVAGVPSILVYILIFMETHISELIVDKPERGLKKGSGLHMDIVLLSFLNGVCGVFGMPWHCAATVRSVTHVSSVTIMSRTHAPGEKPHITDVKEQRISGFTVSLMVGLSVLMAPILRLIPMSVLFGVFLYMGVASMIGVQFFDRLRIFFMPVKHHPQEPYVRRVPTWKMHVFTFVQVSALAILWAVKSSKFSLAFPFFLIMMVPLRQKMASFFTIQEMNALDGNQKEIEADNEPDFYEQAPLPA